jgi:hypothetical protein
MLVFQPVADESQANAALTKLKEAELHVRAVLDEMAVVPGPHRARLIVVLRLLNDVRAQLADTADGG